MESARVHEVRGAREAGEGTGRAELGKRVLRHLEFGAARAPRGSGSGWQGASAWAEGEGWKGRKRAPAAEALPLPCSGPG